MGESMNGPWSESRDAGNPHVRFDERDLETERHERHRARSRLYQAKALARFSRYGAAQEAALQENWIKPKDPKTDLTADSAEYTNTIGYDLSMP